MKRKIRRVAFISSGGDCAGMNSALKRFVEYSISSGLTPLGVSNGLTGLIAGDVREMRYSDVSGIIHRGGTILGSSRSPEFRTAEGRAVAAEVMENFEIDALVMLGGNGSFKAMEVFSAENGIQTACIPSTIDNDVFGSEIALGVDTALNVIRHSLDELRDTATSFRRAFIVETMGRDCGFLALTSALTSGAEICMVPEIAFDIPSIGRRLGSDLKKERSYLIAVVSEAVRNGVGELRELIDKDLGISHRVTVLGHVQRGGSPTVADRLCGYQTMSVALDHLLKSTDSFGVLFREGKWTPVNYGDIEPTIISMKPEMLEAGRQLSH